MAEAAILSVGKNQNQKDFFSQMVSTFQLPPQLIEDVTEETRNRCIRLSQRYFDEWGTLPAFICRAPGRVNLIGEHVDYMGFSVLPMALTNDVLIAAGTDPDCTSAPTVSAINIDPIYPKQTFDVGSVIPDGKWHNYLACGVKGAAEDTGGPFSTSIRMAVDGMIPCASGLSSSSALVCASALATYNIMKIVTGSTPVPSRLQIASVCCKAERYIGTMGGGMDQVELTTARSRVFVCARCVRAYV
jgi:galactokinase